MTFSAPGCLMPAKDYEQEKCSPKKGSDVTHVDEPIKVDVVDGRPASFQWHDRFYDVLDVLHTWSTEEGAWWKLSRREKREYYRVQAGQGRHRITAELYLSDRGGKVQWVLAAVYE